MFTIIQELEKNTTAKLTLSPLKFKRDQLNPYITQKTVNAHYDIHTKGYFDKQEKGIFFKAGAFLHEFYWKQFSNKTSNDVPVIVYDFINDYFEGIEEFQNKFNQSCMKVQGSGWVYLNKNGEINTIPNHKIKHDILILQDCWEHAYYLDYGPNKQKFFDNFWKVIDWNFVAEQL